MIKQIEIKGQKYNLPMANAFDQLEVVGMIGAFCAGNAVALGGDYKITVPFIKGVLLSIGSEKIKRIHDLFLKRCTANRETHPIDQQHFQGRIDTYLTLVAEAIIYNLSDFFLQLEEDLNSEQEQETMESKAQ